MIYFYLLGCCRLASDFSRCMNINVGFHIVNLCFRIVNDSSVVDIDIHHAKSFPNTICCVFGLS